MCENTTTSFLIRAESMSDAAVRQLTVAMRHGTFLMVREGKYWSDEEKQALEILSMQGYSITHIAIALERSESAVCQKMDELRNVHGPCSPKTRIHTPKAHVCLCSKCSCNPQLCPLPPELRGAKEVF